MPDFLRRTLFALLAALVFGAGLYALFSALGPAPRPAPEMVPMCDYPR